MPLPLSLIFNQFTVAVKKTKPWITVFPDPKTTSRMSYHLTLNCKKKQNSSFKIAPCAPLKETTAELALQNKQLHLYLGILWQTIPLRALVIVENHSDLFLSLNIQFIIERNCIIFTSRNTFTVRQRPPIQLDAYQETRHTVQEQSRHSNYNDQSLM